MAVITCAQPFQGNIKLENITFPEGNQLAYGKDIAQDDAGLIWIRANWNFYTYDGHKLSVVDPEVMGFPLPNTRRFHAKKGHPYFYFVRDSLLVFDPLGREVLTMPIARETFTPNKINNITNIGICDDGRLWGIAGAGNPNRYQYIATAEKGGVFRMVCKANISWYYDETLTRNGNYFVKQRDKVQEFDTTGLVKNYLFPQGADPVMPSIVIDEEKTIWVVHSPDKSKDQYAVYYLKEGQEEFTRLPQGHRFPQEANPGHLFADGQFIWHRGNPFRLSRLNIHTGIFEDFTDKILEQSLEFSFYNSSMLNIIRDQSGEVWLTTRAGIVKMTIEEDVFRQYSPNQISSRCVGGDCNVKGITEDESGNIYFSYKNGISRLDLSTGQISDLPVNLPPQDQLVHALSYAGGTLFWNEYAIDMETWQGQKLFPTAGYDYITHGMDRDDKYLWVGVNDLPFEFYRYDITQKDLKKIPIPDDVFSLNSEIRDIRFSKYSESLFLSNWFDGILEFDLEGNLLNNIEANPHSKAWVSNYMYGLYEDGGRYLWFGHGTQSGLSMLDLKTREIIQIPYEVNEFTGLLSRVFQILPGMADDLWLVTEKGTLRLNKKTGVITRFPMFPSLSEMAFNRLPGLASKTGNLYIGTPDGGVNVFDPEELTQKAGFETIFPVYISRYERFNNKADSLFVQLSGLDDLSAIRLSHRDRFFGLEFFVPDYRNTGQLLYTHFLEGYDKNWSNPSRVNRLQYENLPPGQYTLRIRGGLSPEFFESSEWSLAVVVIRAWYKRWWAFTLYILGFLALVYILYRYQVNQQLEKAESKRLKELNTLKSRLYTNITHEFRTPLTVIMGMTNNIKGHSQERKLIQRNSKNLLRLINQLLDLSKLDSGTLKMDKVQGDIVNYLQYLTESFYSMAEEKKIRLTFYPEVKELVMDFDEAKIQHIVYNLLTNAIKFTTEGGKVILHLQKVEIQGTDWLQMKVSDTGIGISQDNLPKIFDRFYQGDASSTRKEAGTGIGLSLTKELVEMMGGSIVVDSQLGEGTDFLLLFPVQLDPMTIKKGEYEFSDSFRKKVFSEDEDQNIVPLLKLATFNENSETPSLLIIEDNRDVATYIESLLKREYHIEIARNGQEGIDKALAIVPDIIISDVMMPEKDGYEVCETLKNDDRTSHIPIILLTAKATVDDRIEGLRGGADAYLVKPFNKEELFIRLEKLIELRKSLQEKNTTAEIFSKNITEKKSVSLDDIFLQKLINVVQERLDDPDLSVNDLCQVARRSNTQVNRKLKALTGKTPSQFIRSIRLQKAVELLKTTDLNVSEIAYDVGFNDPNYFSRTFSEEFGFPPNEVRK